MIPFAANETPVVGQQKDSATPKTRVLLIDDEPDLTRALKSDLEATGRFAVHVENSAFMGIDAARTMAPDVIVLDVCMPFLDGGDVLAALELDLRLKHTVFLMLSSLISHAETNEEGFIRTNGMVMLAKPVRLSELLACIDMKLAGQL